jgi:hypothetical protein
MSLEIDFSSLAEGVAADSRGNLTLVAVNPQVLVADQLPAQFSPILVVVIVDDDAENPVIVTGRTMTGRIEAIGPDDSVLFVAQIRQPVAPPPASSLHPRVQVVAQVPFTASKSGVFRISANIAVVDEHQMLMGEVTASRSVRVSDAASLRPQST